MNATCQVRYRQNWDGISLMSVSIHEKLGDKRHAHAFYCMKPMFWMKMKTGGSDIARCMFESNRKGKHLNSIVMGVAHNLQLHYLKKRTMIYSPFMILFTSDVQLKCEL